VVPLHEREKHILKSYFILTKYCRNFVDRNVKSENKKKLCVSRQHAICAYTRVECKLVAFQIIISSSHIQVNIYISTVRYYNV